MPSLVFHPDLPIPRKLSDGRHERRPDASGASHSFFSESGRKFSLTEVAEHGVGDEYDEDSGGTSQALTLSSAAAGGIFVCFGEERRNREELAMTIKKSHKNELLSKPRQCFLTVNKKDATREVAQPTISNYQYAHLSSKIGHKGAEKGSSRAQLIIRIITQRNASSNAQKERPTTSASSSRASTPVAGTNGRTTARSRSTSAVPNHPKPFTTSTLVEGNKFTTTTSRPATSADGLMTTKSSSLGMRTAMRAASRARQEAQIRAAPEPDERKLKLEKHSFLAGLADGHETQGYRPRRSTSSTNQMDEEDNRGNIASDLHDSQIIVVDLPCSRWALIDPQTIVFQPSPSGLHIKGTNIDADSEKIINTDTIKRSGNAASVVSQEGPRDIVLTFVKAETASSLASILKSIDVKGSKEGEGVEGRGRFLAAEGEFGAGPSEEPHADRMYRRAEGGGGTNDHGGAHDRRDSRSFVSSALSPSAALRERLHLSRYGAYGGVGADDSMDYLNAPPADPASYRMPTSGSGEYLGPGGREVEPMALATEASLAPSTTITSQLMTPAQRRERHWKLMEKYDNARDSYLRFEERRLRDVRSLFEERDRRREAFLRKRSMLREEVVIPPDVLMALEGLSSKDEGYFSIHGEQAGRGMTSDGAWADKAAAADAHWEAFQYMANTLGKKWEKTEPTDVDALISSSQNEIPAAGQRDGSPAIGPVRSGAGASALEGENHESFLSQYAPDIASIISGLDHQEHHQRQQQYTTSAFMLPYGSVLPTVGPASATLNAFHQQNVFAAPHPHSHLNGAEMMPTHGHTVGAVPPSAAQHRHHHREEADPHPTEPAPYVEGLRSASSAATVDGSSSNATAAGGISALDKLRAASRQPSYARGVSVAATVLGDAPSPAPASSAAVASEGLDPSIQAALKAEARLLRSVTTMRMPSAPLPPLAPQANTAASNAQTVDSTSATLVNALTSPSTGEVELSSTGASPAPPAPVAPPPPKKAPPPPPPGKKAPAAPAALNPTQTPEAENVVAKTSTASTQPQQSSSLPEGWKEGKTDDGRTFYWNTQTKERSWKHPSGGSSSSNASAAQPASPAPLPLAPGWKEVTDPKTGKPYYYNTATRETTKVRPTASATNSDASAKPNGSAPPPPPPKASVTLPSGWKEVKAPDGRTYYYNATTKERSWNPPKA